jgi:hypothetical protein
VRAKLRPDAYLDATILLHAENPVTPGTLHNMAVALQKKIC